MANDKKAEVEVSAASAAPSSTIAPTSTATPSTATPLIAAAAPGPRLVTLPLNAKYISPGEMLLVEVPDYVGHEQGFTRPWVVISPVKAHKEKLNLVMAVPLTSKLQHKDGFLGPHIEILVGDMEKKTDAHFAYADSIALTEHARSLSVSRCTKRLGAISKEKLQDIRISVRFFIGV